MTTADLRAMAKRAPSPVTRAGLRAAFAPAAQPERKPGRLCVAFAIQCRNTRNLRDDPWTQNRRAKTEKEITTVHLAGKDLPALPAVVTLTRFGPKRMDDDGNVASLKHVQDAIAALYGVDDGSDLYLWRYAQEAPGHAYAVKVEIQSVVTTGKVRT